MQGTEQLLRRYRYCAERTVQISQCDPAGRLRASALLWYIQSVAGEHLEELNLPHDRLYREGFVFVVAGMALKIHRAPAYGERVLVATAPLFGRGPHLLRETLVQTPAGEPLAECQTNWALLEAGSNKLLRASQFPHELPLLQGEWQPFYDPTRIRLHPPQQEQGHRAARVVALSDLDQNHHMNNTVYADITLDCFGEQYLAAGGVDTLLLRYHRQARLNETLALRAGLDGQMYTVGAQIDGKPCFEGGFMLKPAAPR